MKRRTMVGIIFIMVALLKLADMWGVVQVEWLWQHPWIDYFAIAFLVYIGGEIIIHSFRHNPDQWLRRPLPLGDDGKRICCSVSFGGDAYAYKGETFHGARLDAFLGGIRLDLRKAVIIEDEEIDIHTFLGGIELLVPTSVNVIVKSHSFLGGVSNETDGVSEKKICTIHITASNFLGGISVKYKE